MWWRTARSRPSVLFSQHNGDDTLRDRRISWVWRVRSERLVEIIDLEKYRLAIDLKAGGVYGAGGICAIALVTNNERTTATGIGSVITAVVDNYAWFIVARFTSC